MPPPINQLIPIKLEHGEYNVSASNYVVNGTPYALKMQNGYIDINKNFVPTPSYGMIGDITPAIGDQLYECSYYIDGWFKDPTTLKVHSGYLIFTQRTSDQMRFYSIVRDDGVWEVLQQEFKTALSHPHTTLVRREMVASSYGGATVDPNQNTYPFICGSDKLYTVNRVSGVWSIGEIRGVVGYVDKNGILQWRSESFVKPVDCTIFQNRAWYICSGPGAAANYTGQIIVATSAGSANYLWSDRLAIPVQGAIVHVVFLEPNETMLTIDASDTVVVIGTNKNIRLLKSAERDVMTITGANLVSALVLQAECLARKGMHFYSMFFLPTEGGLIYRFVDKLWENASELSESLILRVRDDSRAFKRLAVCDAFHLLIGLLSDDTLMAFSPPIASQEAGGWLSPSTSYLVTDRSKIVDIMPKGNIVIWAYGKYYIFRQTPKTLPPLTMNSFEYITRTGLWRVRVEGVDETANTLTLEANERLEQLEGIGLFYQEQFFTLQKMTKDPTDYVFLSNVPLNTIQGIETITGIDIDVIPETDDISSFTLEPGIDYTEFGFTPLSAYAPIVFSTSGAHGSLYFSSIDKTTIIRCNNFYAGNIIDSLSCIVEWASDEGSKRSTYDLTASKELTDWLDVNPSNGFVRYKHFDNYEVTRGGSTALGTMNIVFTPKHKYGPGDHRSIKINTIR